MLKTKFAQAFYLCNSFLFITTSFTTNDKLSTGISFERSLSGSRMRSVDDTSRIMPTGNQFCISKKSAHVIFNSQKIKMNRKGMQFVRNYLKKSDESLVGVKRRCKIPFNIIDSVFSVYGLPVELKYLAVIESELKPSALSQVGARGPWQLMPGTAHDLGLKITRQNDERVNYYKSTRAAALYLRDLYAQFDDWLLVLAAYNGGPRPVLTAIHKSGSRNFWILQNFLPTESREHVKKFIATHYYFEGQGSETTLTKAENMKYSKTGNTYAVYHSPTSFHMAKKVKRISIVASPKAKDIAAKTKDIAVKTDSKQTDESENEQKDKDSEKKPKFVRLYESSEHKFRRLMKASEEALKSSNKLI